MRRESQRAVAGATKRRRILDGIETTGFHTKGVTAPAQIGPPSAAVLAEIDNRATKSHHVTAWQDIKHRPIRLHIERIHELNRSFESGQAFRRARMLRARVQWKGAHSPNRTAGRGEETDQHRKPPHGRAATTSPRGRKNVAHGVLQTQSTTPPRRERPSVVG